jgi:hypothetical protein
MRTTCEVIDAIERRNKTLGQILRLYLEQKSSARIVNRKELVDRIIARLNVSPATAYDYANALKILVKEKDEQSSLERHWRPLPIRRARNRFDAITLMAGTFEPPLIWHMKEYALNMWKDLFLGGGPIPCDRNVFAQEFGLMIEKVGNVALLDPDFKHAPKALSEACFIKTMDLMNPLVEIRGVSPHEDALRYVEWILRYRAKKNMKTKKKSFLAVSDECITVPSRGRVEAVYNRKKPIKTKYLKGLNMWFIIPGEQIADALIRYCYDKEIYWEEAVRSLLAKQLENEGYFGNSLNPNKRF